MSSAGARSALTVAAITLAAVACSGDASVADPTLRQMEEVTTTVPASSTSLSHLPVPSAPPTISTTLPTTASTAGEPIEASGVVVAVEGTLQGIDFFTLLLDDGTELTLVPEPGLLFDGGPLGHVRDHLVSGSPVGVVYQIGAQGIPLVLELGDARKD